MLALFPLFTTANALLGLLLSWTQEKSVKCWFFFCAGHLHFKENKTESYFFFIKYLAQNPSTQLSSHMITGLHSKIEHTWSNFDFKAKKTLMVVLPKRISNINNDFITSQQG